jgi:hypothetical protein
MGSTSRQRLTVSQFRQWVDARPSEEGGSETLARRRSLADKDHEISISSLELACQASCLQLSCFKAGPNALESNSRLWTSSQDVSVWRPTSALRRFKFRINQRSASRCICARAKHAQHRSSFDKLVHLENLARYASGCNGSKPEVSSGRVSDFSSAFPSAATQAHLHGCSALKKRNRTTRHTITDGCPRRWNVAGRTIGKPHS